MPGENPKIDLDAIFSERLDLEELKGVAKKAEKEGGKKGEKKPEVLETEKREKKLKEIFKGKDKTVDELLEAVRKAVGEGWLNAKRANNILKAVQEKRERAIDRIDDEIDYDSDTEEELIHFGLMQDKVAALFKGEKLILPVDDMTVDELRDYIVDNTHLNVKLKKGELKNRRILIERIKAAEEDYKRKREGKEADLFDKMRRARLLDYARGIGLDISDRDSDNKIREMLRGKEGKRSREEEREEAEMEKGEKGIFTKEKYTRAMKGKKIRGEGWVTEITQKEGRGRNQRDVKIKFIVHDKGEQPKAGLEYRFKPKFFMDDGRVRYFWTERDKKNKRIITEKWIIVELVEPYPEGHEKKDDSRPDTGEAERKREIENKLKPYTDDINWITATHASELAGFLRDKEFQGAVDFIVSIAEYKAQRGTDIEREKFDRLLEKIREMAQTEGVSINIPEIKVEDRSLTEIYSLLDQNRELFGFDPNFNNAIKTTLEQGNYEAAIDMINGTTQANIEGGGYDEGKIEEIEKKRTELIRKIEELGGSAGIPEESVQDTEGGYPEQPIFDYLDKQREAGILSEEFTEWVKDMLEDGQHEKAYRHIKNEIDVVTDDDDARRALIRLAELLEKIRPELKEEARSEGGEAETTEEETLEGREAIIREIEKLIDQSGLTGGAAIGLKRGLGVEKINYGGLKSSIERVVKEGSLRDQILVKLDELKDLEPEEDRESVLPKRKKEAVWKPREERSDEERTPQAILNEAIDRFAARHNIPSQQATRVGNAVSYGYYNTAKRLLKGLETAGKRSTDRDPQVFESDFDEINGNLFELASQESTPDEIIEEEKGRLITKTIALVENFIESDRYSSRKKLLEALGELSMGDTDVGEVKKVFNEARKAQDPDKNDEAYTAIGKRLDKLEELENA